MQHGYGTNGPMRTHKTCNFILRLSSVLGYLIDLESLPYVGSITGKFSLARMKNCTVPSYDLW